MIILGQRIRLDPNNVQASFFNRCAGTARFVFNLGLARWQEMYDAGAKPNWQKINAEVNARKKIDLSWLCEIPWAVSKTALSDLGNAFSHFFRRVKTGETPGYPRFKKKHRCHEGFGIEGRALRFDGYRVKIPKIGWIRTRQEIQFPGRILSARLTKYAGHWYVSIQVEIDESRWSYPHRCETQAVVGIDLGVRDLAVLSTGERVEAPRSLRTHELQLRRLNKELSRRTRGGKNWRKTKTKLAHLHEQIANIRHAVTHEMTASIVTQFRWIGIEDLNVIGMAANHHLAKSVMDAAMSEVVRQLKYKAPLAGGVIVQADRWFASSKMCHVCGMIRNKLPLGVRRWTCKCGAKHDRDINASKNLENMAATHAVTACRQGSSGLLRQVKLPFGQESSSVVNFG